MKTIVLYQSKTGFVKKYAQWIAQELSADLEEASSIDISRLIQYDAIVYGGGLYAVGINGVKRITQNLERLRGKKIAVFASGASPSRPEAIEEVQRKNFTPAQLERLRFFYLRGGFDYTKLSLMDKVLIGLLEWKIKGKEKRGQELLADERGMLAAYHKPMDFTNRRNIEELVRYIRGNPQAESGSQR